jgi:hypothetical protein
VTGPRTLEGEDLTRIITGEQKKSKKKYVIAESSDGKAVLIDKKWSLYSKDLIEYKPENVELYNLISDKNQLMNVSEKYPKIVKDKIDILREFEEKQKLNKKTAYPFPDWIDEVKREKLVKEGYF